MQSLLVTLRTTAMVALLLMHCADHLRADEPGPGVTIVPKELRTLWVCDRNGFFGREQERYLVSEEKVSYQHLTEGTYVTQEFEIISHALNPPQGGVLLLKPTALKTITYKFQEDGSFEEDEASKVPAKRRWLSYSLLKGSAATIRLSKNAKDHELTDDALLARRLELIRGAQVKKAANPKQPLLRRSPADNEGTFYNLTEVQRLARIHKVFPKDAPLKARDAVVRTILGHFGERMQKFREADIDGLSAVTTAKPLAYRAGMLEHGYDPNLSLANFTHSCLAKDPPKDFGENAILFFRILEKDESGEKRQQYLNANDAFREPFETSLKTLMAHPETPKHLPSLSKKKNSIQ